jgi:hypothetical protein
VSWEAHPRIIAATAEMSRGFPDGVSLASINDPMLVTQATLEKVLRSDAVWRLGERAALVVPGFTVDSGNAGAVLRLCQRLDGVPLALELAAIRLGSLVEKSIPKRQLRGVGPPGCGSRIGQAAAVGRIRHRIRSRRARRAAAVRLRAGHVGMP